MLLLSVCKLKPVNSTPFSRSRNGDLKRADKGILIIDTVMMTNKAFEAFENTAEPSRQRPVQSARATVCKA